MNKSELIDKYIQNKATAGELEQIKRLMEEDADFSAEVTFQLELRQAVRSEEGHKLKQRLQRLEQKTEQKTVRFVPVIWKVAAVLVLGLGLLWFFNKPADLDELYTRNFEPYPNIVAPVVRDANATGNAIEKAFRHYDKRAYAEASAAFKALRDTDTIGYANFYYAISLMADQQVEKAVEALESPGWQTPENYRNQTDWYLALGYLQLQNREKAAEYLEKTIEANSPKATQARKILSEIQ